LILLGFSIALGNGTISFHLIWYTIYETEAEPHANDAARRSDVNCPVMTVAQPLNIEWTIVVVMMGVNTLDLAAYLAGLSDEIALTDRDENQLTRLGSFRFF
jgi:hypothetical protein